MINCCRIGNIKTQIIFILVIFGIKFGKGNSIADLSHVAVFIEIYVIISLYILFDLLFIVEVLHLFSLTLKKRGKFFSDKVLGRKSNQSSLSLSFGAVFKPKINVLEFRNITGQFHGRIGDLREGSDSYLIFESDYDES